MEQKINYPGWEIVREIGTGSFGKVYEIKKENSFAETENSALKVISIPPKNLDVQSYTEELGLDEQSFVAMVRSQMETITKEFSLMSQLKGNSNIVSYEDHNVIKHKDEPGWDIYIRMELLTPLTDYLRNNKDKQENSVDESFVVKLGTDICRALAICENHNIVHRDIKPQNIFINKDGNFKLGDFGIAKNAENVTIGTRIGTFNYMAPEVFNNKPYGKSVDVYSLGLVMYWLLNERRAPFLPMPPAVPTSTDVDNALLKRIKGDEIPAPKNGSEKIKKIILKAIQSDPDKRYSSAKEMLSDLTNTSGTSVEKDCSAKSDNEMFISELKSNKLEKKKAVTKTKKSKKKIIVPIISIIILFMVASIVGFVSFGDDTPEDPYVEYIPEVTMDKIMGCWCASYQYNDYQNILLGGQNIEVNLFPAEMKFDYFEDGKIVAYLSYVDAYDEMYLLCGSASVLDGKLIIAPHENLQDELYTSISENIEYEVAIEYAIGVIELSKGDKSNSYKNFYDNEEQRMLLGSADEKMLNVSDKWYIKSVNIINSSGTETELDENCCQLVFSDGSYTLDAKVTYHSYGDISISWNKTMIMYNGRYELEESHNYITFEYINNYPNGFTIIDDVNCDTYSYNNEAHEYIHESVIDETTELETE